MSSANRVTLKVNGKKVQKEIFKDLSLADFLHEYLGLTGTKVCCGMGVCKACTVAVQFPGEPRLSRAQACITPVAALAEASVITVEGLAQGDNLNPLQAAFLKHFSFQCGYSAPGFLMGATLLMDQLKATPIPKSKVDAVIQESLGEHVCRCTGYVKYFAAIKEVILATPGLTV